MGTYCSSCSCISGILKWKQYRYRLTNEQMGYKGTGTEVKRFEVYLIRLDPTVGKEICKSRPGLIVSPDEMNELITYNCWSWSALWSVRPFSFVGACSGLTFK